jgi:hypothetical protein
VKTYPSSEWDHLTLPPGRPAGLLRSWASFWFTPVDAVVLHGIRVLAGVLFLAWLLPFAGQQEALFGLAGWFDARAYQEAARLPDGLPGSASWSLLYLCGNSAAALQAVYWLSVVVLVLFTLGLWTRVASVLTWLVVMSFTANPATRYGADALLGVLAFYLMVGYVLLGQWDAPPSQLSRLVGARGTWLFGRRGAPPSRAANLALRLLQVHFAIALCVSGMHKLQFGDWWAGVAFWYPLHPPMATTFADVRSHANHAVAYLFVLSLAQYTALAWQVTFPLFAWRRGGWRSVLLLGALVGAAGSMLLYRQPLFGPLLVVGCLSYLTPAEWRWAMGQLARRFRASESGGEFLARQPAVTRT